MKKLLLITAFLLPLHAHAEDNSILASLSARISQLEDQNRQQLGRIEELEYQLKQHEAMMDQMKTEQSQFMEVQAAMNAAAAEQKQQQEQAAANANPYVTKVTDESPEYVRKTPEAPTNASIEEDFDNAFANIAAEDYTKAKTAFAEFIKKHPGTELSGEAFFWLGELAWQDKNYTSAAVNYLKGYKESPKGAKASENILKLALTLKEMGKKDEACKNLQRFDSEFPNAHINLKTKAQKAKNEISCK